MALYKRGDLWWISISHNGKRVQKSTGTANKADAKRYHDEVKASLWRVTHTQDKPNYTWVEAVTRWLEENQHKRSLRDDKGHLRWLHSHLSSLALVEITRDKIDEIARLKAKTGVTPATVNRVLALIRSILRKAEREWEWLDRAPIVRLKQENNKRVRWLTPEEVQRLVAVLPSHLADMVIFSVVTGLRQSNVLKLKWENIDLEKQHAWVLAEEAKGNKAIAIPLNQAAMEMIKKQIGKHSVFVFSYKGQPIKQCNTKAWHNALKKAGIQNFRWHDLRHTWASWHIQNGTSLRDLQELGGWANYEMVLRYAHLNSNHLKEVAEKISATNLLQ